MPFRPKHLLITYDDRGGQCGRVVARMQQMLEDRAFVVARAPLAQAPVDLEPFAGVVLGTPISLRGAGPSQAVLDWIAQAQGLDEKKVALFSAFWALPGNALVTLRNRMAELGAEVVVDHAYWLVRPAEGEHLLPAECMVRVR